MTKRAHYMSFRPRRDGDEDYVGGRPAVQPASYPWPEEDDNAMAFLAQFRVDGERLQVPGAAWVQLYQGFEDGDDPSPIAVLVSSDEGANSRSLPLHPGASPQGIVFEERNDPDEISALPVEQQGQYFLSKLGGADPWGLEPAAGRFLGQLHEAAPKLNLGGRACGLYLRDGCVVVILR